MKTIIIQNTRKSWRVLPVLVLAGAFLIVQAAGVWPGDKSSKAVHAASLSTFNVSEDTFLSSIAPNTEYGSDTKISLCGNGTNTCSVDSSDEKRGLVKYVVSGMPAGSVITSAKIRYYTQNTNASSFGFKVVTDNTWTEADANWTNSNALTTTGSTYTSPAGTSVGWYEVDITGAVSGNGTYSFYVYNTDTTSSRISTKETTSPASTGSQLLLESYVPVTTTFTTTEDTVIQSNSPNTVWGADSRMITCGSGTNVCNVDSADEKRSLMKFNVSGLDGNVTSAKLRFYATTGNTPVLNVQKVTDNTWTEAATTWNNGNALTTDATVYNSNSGTSAGWYEADVTSAIPYDGTYSFVITNPNDFPTRFASKESTSPVAAPELVVTTGQPDPLVVAAGDISTITTTGGNKMTSDLILSINPDAVITTGDNQYNTGSLSDFQTYFHPTWGRFKSKIHPSPGHHEYYSDSTAAGYFGYFGAAATPNDPTCTASCDGYYSWDYEDWHLVALNTNHYSNPSQPSTTYCGFVACDATSEQIAWLEADLAATTKGCTLVYWADPRWSSGANHGSNTAMGAIWDVLYDAKVDLAINGHEHLYERFAKQNPSGTAVSDGVRQFTVGTGGNAPLYNFDTILANSEAHDNSTRGVLKLKLHGNSYDWEFAPVSGGSYTDSGSATCNQ
jgi:hypothetical protein